MVADFDLDALLDHMHEMFSVVPLPETPPILQDIAMVVPERMPAAQVEDAIRKAGGDMLADAQLFDVYRGGSIAEGHKNLAYHLIYRAPDRTLTDKEVAKVHSKIVKAVEKQLGVQVRR